MPPLPRIDMISFWIGFATASLVWFLIGRLQPLLPGLRDAIRTTARRIRQRSLSGVDVFIRRDALQRAQHAHMAAPIFALDDLLVPPLVLVPPPIPNNENSGQPESMAGNLIPYTLDWPELAAGFPVPALPLLDALSQRTSLAVIGQPGSGKTVALADLASRLARRDGAGAHPIAGLLPLYLHVLDLDPSLLAAEDPLQVLITGVSGRVSMVARPQVRRFLAAELAEGSAVLILDGLDECSGADLEISVAFLRRLREKFDNLPVVVAASGDYLDGLVGLGFQPVAVKAWGLADREDLLTRWTGSWDQLIAPEISKRSGTKPVPTTMIVHWMREERGYYTPLEWTLRVWSAFSGDLRGPGPRGALESHLQRCQHGAASRAGMQTIARELVVRRVSTLPYSQLASILTASPSTLTVPQQPDSDKSATTTSSKGPRRGILGTPGEQILDSLLEDGLLVEHAAERVNFCNPLIAGYLAGECLSPETLPEILTEPVFPAQIQAARFCASGATDLPWFETYLEGDDSPLFRLLFITARWLSNSPGGLTWKSTLMRLLVALFQNETYPLSLRARAIAALVASNDTGVVKLFHQMYTSRARPIRQLITIGLGALADPAAAPDLLDLLADPNETIRGLACLALGALGTSSGLEAITKVLEHGDETMRQAAAEALACRPVENRKVLEAAAANSDILTRRAAVFGLARIREPWSRSILEKLAVEDGQWVVRNAAAQAIDQFGEPLALVPQSLPVPWESPWLIAFAAKRGLGVTPQTPSTELILMALTAGMPEDQIQAMAYLRLSLEERAAQPLYRILFSDQSPVRETALNTIWAYTAAGVHLPDPQQFGLG